MHFAERLDLKGAGYRHEQIGQHVLKRPAEEEASAEQDDLNENDRLTPVNPDEWPVVAYPFDSADSDRKRDHGQGVFQGADPVRFGDCHSEERDVACLRVGKDVPMQYECVSLKEAPNKCESGCGPKRLGHLGFACHSYIHFRGIIL